MQSTVLTITSNPEATAALITALIASIASLTVAYLTIRTQRQIARFQGEVGKTIQKLGREIGQHLD